MLPCSSTALRSVLEKVPATGALVALCREVEMRLCHILVVFDTEDKNKLMKWLKDRYVLVQNHVWCSQCLPLYISTVFSCDRFACSSQSGRA